MQNQLNDAVRIIESQVNKIVGVDNQLNEIYANIFKEPSLEKKNEMADKYIELINGRSELLKPLGDVQEFLFQIIKDLRQNDLDWFDRYTQKRKIKKMELHIAAFKPLVIGDKTEKKLQIHEINPISGVKEAIEEINEEKAGKKK